MRDRIYFSVLVLLWVVVATLTVEMGCAHHIQIVKPDVNGQPVIFRGVQVRGLVDLIDATLDTNGVAIIDLNFLTKTGVKVAGLLFWLMLKTWWSFLIAGIIFICIFTETIRSISKWVFFLLSKVIPVLGFMGTAINWVLQVCPKWGLTIVASGVYYLYLKWFYKADTIIAVPIVIVCLIVANIVWEYAINKLKVQKVVIDSYTIVKDFVGARVNGVTK